MMRWLGAIGAALLLGACASVGQAPEARREVLARQIADDAVGFNDAYGRAVSAQILLNIMRARDRLPRHYLATTGISDSPSWSTTEGVNVGGVPLSGGGDPWGLGGASIERSRETRPSYAVQPYDAETLTRTVFDATEPHVFAHYWRNGWPRDLVTLLMVERIIRKAPDGHMFTYNNEANEIFENCAPSVQTGGCDFVRTLREFLARVNHHPAVLSSDPNVHSVCGLVEAYAPREPLRPTPPSESERCDPVFVIEGDFYEFRLRSLDEIIYYVGELLRVGSTNAAPGQVIEAPINVGAAGLRGGGRGVPLFRVSPHGG
ncbi:MAG TPA: hypothetical protein PLK37_14825, partial [Terricaulis sp.]|nr:hypothetical protein [Terricaulis sp.]